MEQDRRQHDRSRRFAQLVAEAWVNPSFKQRLLDSPAEVVAEAGIDVPDGVEPRVVENTDRITYFVLPRQPLDDELSDEQLRQVPGGYHGCRPGDEA